MVLYPIPLYWPTRPLMADRGCWMNHFEERMFSMAEAVTLAKQVERLFAWVALRIGKPASQGD